MARKTLRKIREPFVLPAPDGVSLRSRIVPADDFEECFLRDASALMGGLHRSMVSELVDIPKGPEATAWRTRAKRAATAATSSRYAGALTAYAADQVRFSRMALEREVASLRQSTTKIRARLDAPLGQKSSKAKKLERGYRDEQEWFAKARRLDVLSARLRDAEQRLAAGRPRIVLGGKALLHKRNNLDAAGLSVEQWREQWDASRSFIRALGSADEKDGNSTIRITTDGTLTIKTPGALVDQYGKHVTFTHPVFFHHRGNEWAQRLENKQSVTYTVHPSGLNGRWYIDASWGCGEEWEIPLETLQSHRTLGIDLNDGFLTAAVLDESGNVVGPVQSVSFTVAGLPASTRDARVRQAVTDLIHLAREHDCASITIENLGFEEARTIGRETMGRGKRGKTFRRTVAGLPTAQFRDRLRAMTYTAGVSVIVIDPAYTSQWGREHWLPALKEHTLHATVHHAAAVVIGRRGLGFPARRRPRPGPGITQRSDAGLPAGQPSRKNTQHDPTPSGEQTPEEHDSDRSPSRRAGKGKTVRPAPDTKTGDQNPTCDKSRRF